MHKIKHNRHKSHVISHHLCPTRDEETITELAVSSQLRRSMIMNPTISITSIRPWFSNRCSIACKAAREYLSAI